MFTLHGRAAGPHDASLDHERLLIDARDVEFDWAELPFQSVLSAPYAAVDYLAVSPAARAAR
jgi:hypothetical protein